MNGLLQMSAMKWQIYASQCGEPPLICGHFVMLLAFAPVGGRLYTFVALN